MLLCIESDRAIFKRFFSLYLTTLWYEGGPKSEIIDILKGWQCYFASHKLPLLKETRVSPSKKSKYHKMESEMSASGAAAS